MTISDLLQQIAQLDDDELNLLLSSLDIGMQSEWDCVLSDGLALFGVAEFRVAAKNAISFAATHAPQTPKQEGVVKGKVTYAPVGPGGQRIVISTDYGYTNFGIPLKHQHLDIKSGDNVIVTIRKEEPDGD